MPHFHAPWLFMGAAAIGPPGVMQADVEMAEMIGDADPRLVIAVPDPG
jgi:hypothetical protein